MTSLKKIALLILSSSALAVCSATGAFAEEIVTGRVYQIAPADVYVEAADHTAVKVPISSAIFKVHGVRTEVTNLHIGMPVEAFYTPDSMMEPYNVIYVESTPKERVFVREYREEDRTVREYREGGETVHFVWYNGRWHRR